MTDKPSDYRVGFFLTLVIEVVSLIVILSALYGLVRFVKWAWQS